MDVKGEKLWFFSKKRYLEGHRVACRGSFQAGTREGGMTKGRGRGRGFW